MKNIEDINNLKVKQIITQKKHPEFSPGDIIKVGVKITEGKRDRIQYFEGVCIAKKKRDINSSFTVRKISFGEGVERTFALYSPAVDTIKVIRSGKVRRAKLYYLRDRTGKSARISEKIKKKIGIDLETKIQEVSEKNVASQAVDTLKTDTKNKENKSLETSKVEALDEQVKPQNKAEPRQKEDPKKEELKKEEKK
tara:strand:+ start:263 stop:850 length:588 start_codon:yes stop_codon:yes gene_type:complete